MQAKLFKTDFEGLKVIRKEAKNALLEIAKDDYYRILVLEEGLILVPLVGSAAYNSFKPNLYSWPSLPDGTKIERTSNSPSKSGASELLLGLNVDKNLKLEEAQVNAVLGQTRQQFLVRIGAVEAEDDNNLNEQSSSSERFTLLPWIDGVARLVLIIGLDDESAIARAANSIADSAINEHMRTSFKEAGAVKLLIQLIDHQNSTVRLAVIRALERLSVRFVNMLYIFVLPALIMVCHLNLYVNMKGELDLRKAVCMGFLGFIFFLDMGLSSCG